MQRIEIMRIGIVAPMKSINICDCRDCENSEKPCGLDCDAPALCEGCIEAREYAADILFSIDLAQGRSV